ncbi:Baseplate J-like protein [Enterovibrio nigricans DSM 22720]|uniref:Baseplate J-like protein n=1 Tax=Enterovibrio nigricans DSM 22720 TaxID=1121868 RepID=A0A1T4UV45_9GAMM|nr:Baseplate J-like protein [Enterovibrio nigricans DSM 22720]
MSLQHVRFPDIPEPSILDVNYDADLRRLKEAYQARTGHYPGISDPETVTLEQLAYEKSELKEMINEEGKQNLLPFAVGARLDNLGLLTETERLPASSALTTIQFVMKPHTGFVIHKGFEMMAIDGQTVFVAMVDTAIAPEDTEKAIGFQCQTPGVVGNNFAPGQIAQMVKPLEFVASA